LSNDAEWHALWTRSNCEKTVFDRLEPMGYEVFFPRVQAWTRRRGKRQLTHVPMFPGYLFMRHQMDKATHVEVLRSRGLVRILGERWDRLWSIPDKEIDAVVKLTNAGVVALPYPYLREGQRMRIQDGPLAGIEGIFVKGKPQKGLLVLSVELLKRSLAIEIDCTHVSVA